MDQAIDHTEGSASPPDSPAAGLVAHQERLAGPYQQEAGEPPAVPAAALPERQIGHGDQGDPDEPPAAPVLEDQAEPREAPAPIGSGENAELPSSIDELPMLALPERNQPGIPGRRWHTQLSKFYNELRTVFERRPRQNIPEPTGPEDRESELAEKAVQAWVNEVEEASSCMRGYLTQIEGTWKHEYRDEYYTDRMKYMDDAIEVQENRMNRLIRSIEIAKVKQGYRKN